MGGKKEFIHIRSDERLHKALKESAERAHRKMQDHARYLLEKALGIDSNEDEAVSKRLHAAAEHHEPYLRGHPTQKKKGLDPA